MKRKLARFIPRWLRNRYGASAVFLLVWIAFFDKSDALTTYKNRRALHKLENEKDRYISDIALTQQRIAELSGDPTLMEKFARERYYMKRKNEDVFVLVPEKD
ncbi:MAG: septum formation initiator family protein [Flavobacteriales bacterium]|nr:septum formation initiator family protein [Flavobacteriales bacterium]MBK9194389.1 septum formation initiator family protein [Flavobacteriales bacterium]